MSFLNVSLELKFYFMRNESKITTPVYTEKKNYVVHELIYIESLYTLKSKPN